MNYLDLFSGIGGFALGAYWAGMRFENHYFSEIDPYCVDLYSKRFPDAIPLGDIKKIDYEKLPKGDYIITGGFPCQDISIAGKGKGITGERSGLWFEMLRAVGRIRPRFLIVENVPMLVGRGLDIVLGGLAEIGYDAEWQDIRASDMGAPHRRERIWIVANPSLQLPHGSGAARERRGELADHGEDVANPSIPRLQGQESARGGPGESRLPAERGDEFPDTKSIRRGCIQGQKRELEKIGTESNGSNRWWSTEPDVGELVDGVPIKLDEGLNHAEMESKKSSAESTPSNEKMRVVRSDWKITETSPGYKKGKGDNNTVPDVSCKSGQIARYEEIKTDAEMCGLRENLQSTGQPCSQDLRLRLSENPWERKCIEAVAWESEPIEIGRLATGVKNRVDRLKGLGNAIIPQIAQILFQQIKELL